MQLFGTSVIEHREKNARVSSAATHRNHAGNRLRAAAAVMLALAAGTPPGFAQQAPASGPNRAASDLPAAPAPVPTEPLNLRATARDFSQPAGKLLGNPNLYLRMFCFEYFIRPPVCPDQIVIDF